MIETSIHDGIAVVTLKEPALLASADLACALALRDAIRDSADLDDVKAIVLRGEGQDFCAPATPGQRRVAERTRSARRRAWHSAFCAPTGLYQNIAYCKKFTLTQVQGRCAGPGSMLVLCSDHTVCSEDASFAAPFADLPESNLVLAMLTMRLNRAKAWALDPDPWSAGAAEDCGLVNRVVPRQALQEEVMRSAVAASKMPLDGIAMTKLLLEAYQDTQGIGQEFDMAALYADSLQVAAASQEEAQ